VNVAAENIQAFYSCLAEFFQAEGPLSAAIKTALKHLLVNKFMYEEHHASNRNFLSMFLFRLDLMVQNFLQPVVKRLTDVTLMKGFWTSK
jgi:hypothetical protein